MVSGASKVVAFQRALQRESVPLVSPTRIRVGMSLEQCANERGVVGEDSPIERWRSVVAATGESASSCRDSRDDVCIVRVVYLLGARWSGLDWVSRIIAVLRPPRRRRRDG